jgi:hypothetical protein
MYPIGLELSVENTYPVDEAAGTALIFLSGQIQAAILITISSAMEQELTPEAQKISVILVIKIAAAQKYIFNFFRHVTTMLARTTQIFLCSSLVTSLCSRGSSLSALKPLISVPMQTKL